MRNYLKKINELNINKDINEYDLLKRIQNKDKKAIEILYHRYLKHVVSIAKKYQNLGIDLLDLIQYGNIGLYEAIIHYDLNKGTKFKNYAYVYIKGAITRSLSKYARSYHLSISKAEKIVKINKYEEELLDLNEEEIINQLANKMDMKPNKIKELRNHRLKRVTYDIEQVTNIPISNEQIDIYKSQLLEILNKAISELNAKEQYIINSYYGFNDYERKTLDEIGVILNISKERVRQIRNKSLIKIKNGPYGVDLKDYLGII